MVRDVFRGMVEYMCAAQDDVTERDLVDLALSPDLETDIMTVAERLKKEGILEGKREGILEGKREGILEGEASLLLRQLISRFGTVEQCYRKQLEYADSDTLLTWSERILTADTIEEVFDNS